MDDKFPGKIENNIIVELHIPDFNAAKDFYGSMGFRAVSENKPDAEAPGYLVMKREDELGNTMLNFYGGDDRVYDQSFFKQFSKDTARGYEISITIPVKNIEELYQKALSSQKRYIQREIAEKSDREWKWRDFRMSDPFGFYLRFTELIDWGQNK